MQRMHGWIGRKDRSPVEIDAVVHRRDGTRSPVRLTNLTQEGCRIETDDDFRIGERFEIAIPKIGQRKAQVRWALAGSAGALFIGDTL